MTDSPNAGSPGSPGSGDKPAPTPYDLEPAAPAPTPPPSAPASRPSKPAPSIKAPKLNAEGVLTGFDEDADFDRDPDVEKVLGGKKHRSSAVSTAPIDTREPFVTKGIGNAQVWGIVGGFLLTGAVVAAAMNSPEGKKLPVALLTLYTGIVHTGTGMVAVYLASKLTARRVGEIELAAGRMITAVGAFLLIFSLNIRLIGDTHTEELLLAAIAYVGLLAGLFRLWGHRLAILGGAHFMLWIIFEMGMQLSAWASIIPAAAPAGGTH